MSLTDEELKITWNLCDQVNTLKARNRELLEILKEVLKVAEFEKHPFRPWHEAARRAIEAAEPGNPSQCPKGGAHEWGTDGQHSNEYCKKCFVTRKEERGDV